MEITRKKINTIKILAAATIFTFPQKLLAAKGVIGELQDAQQTSGLKNVSLETTIGKMINGALGFVGIIFLVLMIYAGYLWMTAGGNEEQVSKAKKIIRASIIGLIIIAFSYAITGFIVELLIEAST